MNLPEDNTRLTKAGWAIGRGAFRRRGYSLLEMLVAIMITSLILTSVAVALHSLFRVNRGLRDHAARVAAHSRFSLQLRADLHGAVSIQLDEQEDATTLVVRMPDETVDYRVEADRVIRVARRGDEVAHREVFPLPENAVVHWELGSGELPRTVAMEIRSRVSMLDTSGEGQRSERVEAVAGLDLPYTVHEEADAKR